MAIVLQVISSDLPQRQQEGLETVVGALAVGMVTYMIIFMRKRSRPPERRERTIVSSGGMRRGRRGAGPATAAAVLALLASGCSSSSTGSGGSTGTAANPGTSSTVTIDLTAQGCAPKPARIPAGSVDFNVTNSGAGSVSEAELRTADLGKILGEKENLTPGLSGSFSLTLQPGTYKVSCPGASQPHWTFTVTGKATGPSWQSDPRLAVAVRATPAT